MQTVSYTHLVPREAIGQLRSHYEKTCPRLVPEISTELIVLDKDAQPALESSAGYNQFLIGAPHYLLLMSAPHLSLIHICLYVRQHGERGAGAGDVALR